MIAIDRFNKYWIIIYPHQVEVLELKHKTFYPVCIIPFAFDYHDKDKIIQLVKSSLNDINMIKSAIKINKLMEEKDEEK